MNTFNDPNHPEDGIESQGRIYPEEIRNPEVDYDRTDMSAKAIVGFLIFLAIAGVITHLVLWGIYKNFAGSYKASTQLENPNYSSTRQMLPQGDPVRTFPAPRLQPDDVADMNKLRAEEDATLSTYDWVDQNAGVVRVPIDRAIQSIAQQGLPTRQNPQESATAEQSQAPTPGSGGAMRQGLVRQPTGPPFTATRPQ